MRISSSPVPWRPASYLSAAASSAAVGLVAALFLVSGPVQAQDVHLGGSAGVTAGTLKGDASAVAGHSLLGTELPARFAAPRIGFHVGVTLRARLTTCLSARTALHYTQQGGVVDRERIGPADGVVRETAEFQLDYLTIPLLAHVRLPAQVAGFRPSVYAGPALGFNLRSTAQREYRTDRGREHFTTDVETAPAMVSVVTGMDVAYPLANGDEVALDLRYGYGLSDVVTRADAAAHLGALRVGLHYVFP